MAHDIFFTCGNKCCVCFYIVERITYIRTEKIDTAASHRCVWWSTVTNRKLKLFPHQHRRVLRKAEKKASLTMWKLEAFSAAVTRERESHEFNDTAHDPWVPRELETCRHWRPAGPTRNHARRWWKKRRRSNNFSLRAVLSPHDFCLRFFKVKSSCWINFSLLWKKVCVSHILLALFGAIPVDFSHFPLSLSIACCCSPHATRMEPTWGYFPGRSAVNSRLCDQVMANLINSGAACQSQKLSALFAHWSREIAKCISSPSVRLAMACCDNSWPQLATASWSWLDRTTNCCCLGRAKKTHRKVERGAKLQYRWRRVTSIDFTSADVCDVAVL